MCRWNPSHVRAEYTSNKWRVGSFHEKRKKYQKTPPTPAQEISSEGQTFKCLFMRQSVKLINNIAYSNNPFYTVFVQFVTNVAAEIKNQQK